ncbi:MAG: glycosyltransferase family 39 protein [Solirubrobacteraceae bacterium]
MAAPTSVLRRGTVGDRRIPFASTALRRRFGHLPTLAFLAGLVGISLLLRVRLLGAGLWVDDAQAVGIASHGIRALPRTLQEDGAPPLYYALLSLWINAFGSGEVAVCALALACATAAIGAGMWAAGSLFGLRAGLICATCVALSPLLSNLAGQARMYALVVLLSLLTTGSFVQVFVHRRRRYLVPFVVLLALMLYTHYWALFYGAGLAVAAGWLVERSTQRRAMARDALLAFAGAGILFAPWLPVLADQARHTGAPWSIVPDLSALGAVSTAVLGVGLFAPAMLASGAGLARVVRRAGPDYHAVLALLIAAAACMVLAWAASQLSPNWAPRYFAILFGPLLLPFSLGLARVGVLGPLALLVLLPGWAGAVPSTEDYKSNARRALAAVSGIVRPGDLVLSTQPEQLPVLSYYLPPGLRYLTPAGPVADPTVFDWRNGVRRLRASRVNTDLRPRLDRLPVGQRVLLAVPMITTAEDDQEAVWPNLVRRRTLEWARVLARDGRFRVLGGSTASDGPVSYSGVGVGLYVKVRAR